MSKHKLKDDLKEKYGLTGMEVDDLMRYVKALSKEFEVLSKRFKTEHLIELQTYQKKAAQNKSEKNIFLKMGKGALNSLSSKSKDLQRQYSKTKDARDLTIASINAHKISGNPKSVITDILSLMSEHNQFSHSERVITGRRAFESLSDASIEA